MQSRSEVQVRNRIDHACRSAPWAVKAEQRFRRTERNGSPGRGGIRCRNSAAAAHGDCSDKKGPHRVVEPAIIKRCHS